VTTRLLDPGSVRRLATRLQLRPSKQRGQNFVTDANTVRRIVQLAGVRETDTVLEVGPGLGSLTLGLLEVAQLVIAVEIDPVLADALPGIAAARAPVLADRLQVVTADAQRIRQLPAAPDIVVANLPYNVAVPVLLHLLATFDGCRRGLVMVQTEVADRLAAGPGSKIYGVPSAKMAWYGSATRRGTVPPRVFWPVPNVGSGLVGIQRRPPPETTVTREQVFTVVDAAFAHRRKMLRTALAGLAGSAAAATQVLRDAGVDPAARGETCDIAQFARIAERLPRPVP
jgi:16S rRNA (adenine1518-N6/adenine1519-N6)-dimethyltransferase